ncbi:MAG: glycosyltransferase [Candidatus Sumerlaeia bacterium]|nr:glycosyltransferase [Candidatus Sumerlaeia bacterium]
MISPTADTKPDSPHVMQIVACINIQVGGPSYSVPRLSVEVQKQGIKTTLFTYNNPDKGPMNHLAEQVNTVALPLHPLEHRLWSFSRTGSRTIMNLAKNVDLIHNHGLWLGPNRDARRAANRHSVPLIISPRGMLNQWSLKHHPWRKKLAWWAYERSNIHSAALLHATSELEAEEIFRLGLAKQIAIIPNGVDVPAHEDLVDRKPLERHFPELEGKKWILFLSRLHEKKGVDDLLHAWARVERQYPDWHLILAGGDFSNYQEKLEEMTFQLQLGSRVTFTGPLVDTRRASALNNCEFVVLPSHSENFGLVVAEALIHRKPVITTHGTPWKILAETGSGWWIDKSPEALHATLLEALGAPAGQLRTMGEIGHRVVCERYCWEPIGQQMAAVYRWLLKQGEKPECVQGR